MQVVSCKKKKRRRKQIEAIWSEPTHFVTEVLLLRIWASKETEVRGQWLEGKTKNQLQVVSRKLQVKKPSKTSLGSREIKANRFSAWWFSVRRGEPWSNNIKIPTRSFVGMTESILFGIITRCHPELVSGSGFWRNRGWGSEVGGWKERLKTGSPLNGSPFSE